MERSGAVEWARLDVMRSNHRRDAAEIDAQ